ENALEPDAQPFGLLPIEDAVFLAKQQLVVETGEPVLALIVVGDRIVAFERAIVRAGEPMDARHNLAQTSAKLIKLLLADGRYHIGERLSPDPRDEQIRHTDRLASGIAGLQLWNRQIELG